MHLKCSIFKNCISFSSAFATFFLTSSPIIFDVRIVSVLFIHFEYLYEFRFLYVQLKKEIEFKEIFILFLSTIMYIFIKDRKCNSFNWQSSSSFALLLLYLLFYYIVRVPFNDFFKKYNLQIA